MKKKSFLFISFLACALTLAACNNTAEESKPAESKEAESSVVAPSSVTPQPSSNVTPASSQGGGQQQSSQGGQQQSSQGGQQQSSQGGQQSSQGQQQSSQAGDQSSQAGQDSSQAEVTKYYIEFNNEKLAAAPSGYDLGPDELEEYKVELGNVEKNQEIKLLDEHQHELTNNVHPEVGNNNVVYENKVLSIHNDASDAFALIKVYEDSIALYVSGYVADEVPGVVFKAIGANNEWNYAANTAVLVDATNPEDVAAGKYDTQLKVEFDVEAEDAFKIHDGDSAWYGYSELEESCKENFDSDENGNIVAKYDGEVELFLKFKDGGASIYINFTKDQGQEQHVNLTVQVAKDVDEGKAVYIIGDFCEWQIAGAIKMSFDSDNEVWTYTIDAVVGQTMSYKLAIAPAANPTQEDIEWEMAGDNRSYTVTAESGDAPVVLVWGNLNPNPDPDPEKVYKILGLGSGENPWDYASNKSGNLVKEEGAVEKYTISNLPISAAQAFKISDGTNWYGYSNFQAGESFAENGQYFVTNNDGNIIARYQGTMTVSLMVKEGVFTIEIAFVKGEDQLINISLKVVQQNVGENNSLYLLGAFCEWHIAQAVKFTYDAESDAWLATIPNVKVGEYIECKLVTALTNNPEAVIEWEKDGDNRNILITPDMANGVNVLVWGNY